MLALSLARLRRFARRCADTVRARVSAWTKPRPRSLATVLAADLVRSRRELLLQNAALRRQVVVLSRSAERPACTPRDRALPVLLASRLRTWAGALLIVQPGTVLRWHRRGVRRYWRRESAARAHPSPLPAATSARIKRMAVGDPLWGAERIRGELRKLASRASERTVQTYVRQVLRPRPRGQVWATFLRNHAHETRAGDVLRVTDGLCRPLFASCLVAPGSRRAVHAGATRHPTDAWVAQQLREATPYGEHPRCLIRDNGATDGPCCAQLAAASDITIARAPARAPRAHAIAERFPRSVRRECPDHLIVRGEGHLRRVLREYVASFNAARPHRGRDQCAPLPGKPPGPAQRADGALMALPIPGGLHHTYRRAA